MGKNNKPYSIDYVEEEFNKKGYILISKEYKNKNTKLDFICNKHFKEGIQQVTFASFSKNRDNCKYCRVINASLLWNENRNFTSISNEEFRDKHYEKYKNKLYELVGDEYSLVDIYKNSDNRTRLKLIHNICNNDYDVEQNKFFSENCRCQNPKCVYERKRNKQLKTTYEFKTEVYNLVGDEYQVETEYIGKDENILFKHMVCNNYFYKTPHNFLAGQRCPHCVLPTKGENAIINVLDCNNISYEFQKSYDDLRGVNKGLLSYDFYLPQENILIEYQGQYHDNSVGCQTDEEFAAQQEHDRRKKEYAKTHNIDLLEIWYWDFDNIEQIIVEKLQLKVA